MGLLSKVGKAVGIAGDLLGIGSGIAQMTGPGVTGQGTWQQNYDAQKEFAQQGIRWKVADAKAAGIHPIYALGSQGASYTPSFGAGDVDNRISGGLAQMGQSLSGTANRISTAAERAEVEGFNAQVRDLELRRMQLQNKALENDVALGQANLSNQVIRTQQSGPPFPTIGPDGTVIRGQGNARQSALIKVNPAETVANVPGRPGTEAASIPDLGFARTNDGGYSVIPSKEVKERIEDNMVNEVAWNVRNQIPAIWDSPGSAPPKSWLPSGYNSWRFSFWTQTWYPSKAPENTVKGIRESLKSWGARSF